MPKLVDEREFVELRNQRGFDALLLSKLRAERRRTYKLYLSELTAEFRLLSQEALNRAANDPGVAPGFAEEVIKAKTRFTISVWLLRASLYLPGITLPRTYQWTLNLVGVSKSGT